MTEPVDPSLIERDSFRREIDEITVHEMIRRRKDTGEVSISYEADGVFMYDDDYSATGFSEPLTDSELRDLLDRYGFAVSDGEQ